MIDVGQTVGNYSVTAKLGEGGMGMVFLAEHPVIGSKVAIKAIHPHLARSAEIVSRFVTEARAVNQIGHDHIVNITDFGTTPDGDFYFIMEHLHGEMLSDCILRQGAFSPARALNIAAQIADALNASHDQGVIHRDLKPDNIYLIERDTTVDFVKVLDFGLAKLTHTSATTPTHNTGAGTVMGTPYYMSPEQCEGKVEVDHRADIYALGVILFEMLTGCVPFGGSGYGEVIIKHVTVRAPAASSLVPALPPAMDAILSRALSKDAAHRFQTMSEFRAALVDPDGYLSSLPTSHTEDNLSERIRAAVPKARTELKMAPLVSGVAATQVAAPAPVTSTFRHGAGEVIARPNAGTADAAPFVSDLDGLDEKELQPKRNRGGVLLLALTACAGIAIVSTGAGRRAAEHLAAAEPSRPASVRVAFSSDPLGATVVRGDGTIVGVTPMALDVPYGERPVDYVVRKDGYAQTSASFVPTGPTPVFARLQALAAPAEATAVPEVAPVDDPPLVTAARPLAAMSEHRHHHRARASEAESPEVNADITVTGEGDDVLAPSER